jgi:hypothetical protein
MTEAWQAQKQIKRPDRAPHQLARAKLGHVIHAPSPLHPELIKQSVLESIAGRTN